MKFRKVAPLCGAIALAVGLIAPSASADDLDPEGWLPVNFDEVCRLQGHSGAYNIYDELFTWSCYDKSVSVPLGITFSDAGALDIQNYCNIKLPGSQAQVTDQRWSDGWSCVPV